MYGNMKIVILDAETMGADLDFSPLKRFGELVVYPSTAPGFLTKRIADADIIVVNKIKLNRDNLEGAKRLKLICLTATGYDNIDINYCWQREIGVCNVKAYSTESVAQVTMLMALELLTHLSEYRTIISSGKYTRGESPLCTAPVFHEIDGLTWGVVGYGAIGRRVAQLASAFGCNILVCSRRMHMECSYDQVTLDELCMKADIISLHVPLNDNTRRMINSRRLKLMKKDAILINVARGDVIDELAACDAVVRGEIGGLASDVYSTEPMTVTSPYNAVTMQSNVILTPHMAWAAYESRVRCIKEVEKNIETFIMGGKRNRVDL